MKATLVFLLCWNSAFSQKMAFVDYLYKNDYRCTKIESYRAIVDYVDSNRDLNNQIIYLEADDLVYGFTFLENSDRPELFICNNKSVTYFLSTYSRSPKNVHNSYQMTLNNLYSAYHISFDNATISYIMFGYGFPDLQTIINSYKIGVDDCKKASIRCEKIPYPNFMDTTCIRSNYRKFNFIDVEPNIKNLSFENKACPSSGILEMFQEFLRSRM